MTPLPTITLITLDLDDTLWPCEPVILAAERAMYRWLQRWTPRLARAHDTLSLRTHRRQLGALRPDIAHDITELRRLSLSMLLEEYRYPGNLAEQAIAVFLEERNRVQPYPEVASALKRLGRRYRLVATTNGNADVERTPLRGLFHYAITAAQAGAAKPAPELFLRALEWAGAEPRQALHLGDDPHMDVQGARQIGMRTGWVNRLGKAWPEDQSEADITVADLDAVADWVGV
jgi:putative hydrolase of the HAD superfamily